MTRNLPSCSRRSLVAARAPAPAEAANRFTIRGAGFGHGVGMSQYGAYGYASHGWTHDRILAHYYSRHGARAGSNEPRDVRVLLHVAERQRVVLGRDARRRAGALGRARPTACAARAGGQRGPALGRRRRRSPPCAAPLRVTGPGRCAARPARRTAPTAARSSSARARFGGVNVINALDVEDYVRGVVPRESPASWPLEALKAQAVAARTYAVTTSKGGTGWDQYPDTRSQVYGGVGRREAVDGRGRGRDRGRGRHLPGRARRDLLLLHLGRPHGERREHVAGHGAAAVAELRRGPVRRASPRSTAGARTG